MESQKEGRLIVGRADLSSEEGGKIRNKLPISGEKKEGGNSTTIEKRGEGVERRKSSFEKGGCKGNLALL